MKEKASDYFAKLNVFLLKYYVSIKIHSVEILPEIN